MFFRDQISQICNFESKSSIPVKMFIINMFDLFIKIEHIAILRPNLLKFLISRQHRRSTFRSSIILTINELSLHWLPNLIALAIYFIFVTNFSWNEGIYTCFSIECMLLGHNFYFLVGSLLVTACYLVVTAHYCSLLVSCWWLLLVTARCNF